MMTMIRPAARFRSKLWSLMASRLSHNFAAMSTHKAVIFDMYGVLIPSPVKLVTLFEQQNSITPGTLGQAIRSGGEGNTWKSFMRGELGAEEFVEAFARQCSDIAGRPVPIGLFLSALISGPMTRPLPVMMEAVQLARSRGLKTAVLSNNFLQPNGEPFMPLDRSLFDVIVESCKEGLSKPDPRIFHLCLDRLGVSAHEAVLLDDLEFNVKAAAQLGMHAIKVGDPTAAVEELGKVLWTPLSGCVHGTGPGSPIPMDQLTQYLRSHLPDKDPITVQQSPSITQTNSLYHLTSGGRHLLLRKQQKGCQAVDTEYRLLKALRGSSLPVPEIVDLCEDSSVLGVPFLLMEVCPGTRFRDPTLPGVDPGDRRAMYRAATNALSQIHQTDPGAVGLDGGVVSDSMGYQVEWWAKQYKDSRTPPVPAMERLIEWFPLHLPKPQRTTLVHGNFRLENLVFHPERPEVVAILDWGHSTLGDPRSDLTSSCVAHFVPWDNPLLTGMSDRDLVQLDIPSVEEVFHQYCHTMGLEEGVPDWQFYVAFHLFCLAVRARQLGDSRSSTSVQSISGRLAEQMSDLAWDFATKEGFRIFNAMPRGSHTALP
ncbi:acyl-CoA dehydrogenase family member 10-like isoform X1 [Esox lucius]|uniref:Aminoglycoside phosphotransferase domain-containing protein n=2 Tax=Esox lucius TaxID=8010 RepID=A0A3P8Z294_ESOLU|nr:acyl-CoA dehydrogenase family member 10-like isoform X1 [Esox lucius]